MLTVLLLAMLAGMVISGVAVGVVRSISVRRGTVDSAPLPGQIKMAARPIPNTGGVGLVLGIVLPLLLGLAGLWAVGSAAASGLPDPLDALTPHLPGMRTQTPLAITMLAAILGLHALGLIDDRRPLGPLLKLGLMAGLSLAVIALPPMLTGDPHSGTRLVTVLDGYAGGSWLSILLTTVWFLAVINAMNFIDNMDGACAGVAAIAGGCFLAATILQGQWFVAGMLALLVGSCVGFLLWNYPRAKIFMGDGGSLVIGFLLAFLTTRTTYITPAAVTTGEAFAHDSLHETAWAGGWYGVLMPLLVLAVPLYDMSTVTLIRLRQGKSPFVGDLQHLSHRLVKRGLSRKAAVAVIWGFTAAMGIPAIALGSLNLWQAMLVGVQALLLLITLALLEWSSSPVREDV